MSALRGIAVITGAAGLTFTAGIVSATSPGHNQSISHSREADHHYVKNGSGDSVADYITDRRQMLTISVVPYHATTISGARTCNDEYKLQPGTKVTVVDADGASIDGAPTGSPTPGNTSVGDYLLMSVKDNRPNDGNNVLDLELQRWDDNNLTTIPS